MSTLRPDDAQVGTPTAGGGGARVQAVERAVELLKAVAAAERPATAWELAAACNLNRTTAWRLLTTLEHSGLVERDAVTGRFSVGYAAIQVAAGADHDALARRVRPVLERYAQQTGESVTLAAARRFSLVYVDQVDPPGVPWPNWLGRSLPLHATSSGKVFLAWLPQDEREALLPAELARFTPRTVTDRAGLERELERIRQLGYGTCLGELEEFSSGVSAAVLDAALRPTVIVNIWGPSQRITRERLAPLGQAALRAAHEISVLLA